MPSKMPLDCLRSCSTPVQLTLPSIGIAGLCNVAKLYAGAPGILALGFAKPCKLVSRRSATLQLSLLHTKRWMRSTISKMCAERSVPPYQAALQAGVTRRRNAAALLLLKCDVEAWSKMQQACKVCAQRHAKKAGM